MAKSTGPITIPVISDETVGISDPISSNQGVHQGVAFFIKVIIPSIPSNATTTLKIYDKDEDLIYSIPDLADDAIHIISDIQIPLVERETVSATLSVAPENNIEIVVKIFYISDYR